MASLPCLLCLCVQGTKSINTHTEMTMLAMHQQQSTDMAQLRSNLEAERLKIEAERNLRIEAEAAKAAIAIELATKTAELEGLRATIAQVAPLQERLATAEAARARAEAEVAEKTTRIAELQKTSNQHLAGFLAMSSMDHAKMQAFSSLLQSTTGD